MSEATEQRTLFQWAALVYQKYPELQWMFHIPNGGSRDVIEAKHLKDQGTKSGVPDIFLPVPRGKYYGMFIEMKYGKNVLSENQKTWIAQMEVFGYRAVACYGFEEARGQIEEYMKGETHERTEAREA